MSQQIPDIDWPKLNAVIEENFRWAKLFVTLQEISEANKTLVDEFKSYDKNNTVLFLSSLLTIPELQSNCIRLEILVFLAVLHCKGMNSPTFKDASRWFKMIGESDCVDLYIKTDSSKSPPVSNTPLRSDHSFPGE